MKVNSQKIIVTLEKLIYRKPDSNWCIIKTNRGSAKGPIPFEIKDNDNLELEGFFQTSEFNGESEFIFKTALLSLPTDSKALLHYACTLTKGIGEAKEQKIWETLGEKWIESDLSNISGITASTQYLWTETLQRLNDQKQQTQTIAFLLSKKATLNLALAAWELWKDKTITKVMENCYCLTDLPHYGFSHIDTEIRKEFGITDKDPRRIDSAFIYSLQKLTETKGTCIDRQLIVDELCKIVPDVVNEFEESVTRLINKNKIIMLNKKWIALGLDYTHETLIWQRFTA